jgi:hypothetical protein
LGILFYALASSKFNFLAISDAYNSLSYKMRYTLGRSGTLNGLANDENVYTTCEEIVSLKPENGLYRDTRGLNRALRGDYDGAIEDFEAFVAWAEKEIPDETNKIEKRKAWIEALRRGKNPFDEATLAELRRE